MKAKCTIALLLVVGLVFVFASGSFANEKAAGFEVRDNDTIIEVLNRQVGKTVELQLVSGGTLRGKVAKVLQHVVHLEKLTGKEFYDAVVRHDRINTVIVRVRGN